MKNLCVASLLIAVLIVGCKAQPVKTTGLENGFYSITSINGQTVTTYNLTVEINADKDIISGFSGCNNYRFNYKESVSNLDLGFGVSSKMYCEDTQAIENAFFEATSRVTGFKQTKQSLELINKEGSIEVKAVKKDK